MRQVHIKASRVLGMKEHSVQEFRCHVKTVQVHGASSCWVVTSLYQGQTAYREDPAKIRQDDSWIQRQELWLRRVTDSPFEYVGRTRKPCCRKETARCRSCSFRFRRQHSLPYNFKSQASKARLHSSKHSGTKQNLRQNGDSRSFKVTCFGVSGKAITQ